MLKKKDYGATWNPVVARERRPAFSRKKIEFCARGTIDVPGEPNLVTNQFGDKERRQDGANHAELFMLYKTPAEAEKAFSKMKEKAAECRPKTKVSRSPFPQNTKRSLPEFDATWTPKETPIGEWNRVGGIQQGDYPDRVSKFNVVWIVYDYAVRGNLVLVSIYWQSRKPGSPGTETTKAAEDALVKQLERLG